MEKLIKRYESEILFYKGSMIEFALKDAVAYNVASAKVETYQRIVEDLKQLPEPPTEIATININGKEYTKEELTSELNILNCKLGNLKTLLAKNGTLFTLSNSNNASIIEMSLPAISDKIEYEIEVIKEEINNLESYLDAL